MVATLEKVNNQSLNNSHTAISVIVFNDFIIVNTKDEKVCRTFEWNCILKCMKCNKLIRERTAKLTYFSI